MAQPPPSVESIQHELERKEAVRRTETLLRLKERLDLGILPDKDELISLINSANVEIDQMKSDLRISSLGKQILTHASDLLDALKPLIKREGLARTLVELSREGVLALQDSAAELGRMASQLSEQVSAGMQQVESKLQQKAPELKSEAEKRVRSASERLLSIVRRLIGSAEGRRMTSELVTLLRRLLQITGETLERAGQQTQEAAATSTPSEPESKSPAAKKTSKKSAKKAGSKKTKKAKQRKAKPGTAHHEQPQPQQSERQQGEAGDRKRESVSDAPEEKTHVHFKPSSPAKEAAEKPHRKTSDQPEQPHEKEKIEQTAKELRDTHLESVKQALPSEQQVKDIRHVVEQGTEQMKRETDEHLETIEELARRLLRRAIDHPEMREAVRDIVAMLRQLFSKVEEAVEQVTTQLGKPSASGLVGTSKAASSARTHADRAIEAADALLRSLAGSDTVDALRMKFKEFGDQVQKDQHLKQWFQDLFKMLEQPLEDPRVLDNGEYFNQLIGHGKHLFNLKENQIREVVDDISRLLNHIAKSISDDAHVKDLKASACALYSDLWDKDAQGRTQLKPEAMQQLRMVLAPTLARRLQLLALPPIAYDDESYYLQLKELVLHAAEIPPETLQAHMESDMSIDLRTMRASSMQGKLTITLRNLELHAPNTVFHFHKKTFPKLTDEGHVDLHAKGVNLVLQFEQRATHPYLSRATARCEMADFHVVVKNDADHQVLLQWFTNFYKDRMGAALAEAIIKALQGFGDTAAGWINKIADLAWTVAAPAGSSVIESVTGRPYSLSTSSQGQPSESTIKLSSTAEDKDSMAFSKTTTTATVDVTPPQPAS